MLVAPVYELNAAFSVANMTPPLPPVLYVPMPAMESIWLSKNSTGSIMVEVPRLPT